MKSLAYALTALLLLPGCSPAPIVSPPVQVECPRPPPLARVPLGPSFQDRMEDFLRGKLPEQTSFVPASPRATAGPTK